MESSVYRGFPSTRYLTTCLGTFERSFCRNRGISGGVREAGFARSEVNGAELTWSQRDFWNSAEAEKIELRDEKQRLKTEKESLEQQAKFLNAARPSFIPHPPVIPTAFSAPGKNPGQKLMMPVMGYPGFPMWQFMHPSDVDTSQDAESCPPVA